ncbi:MAG: fumarylacetoacetate hydrolase family protein [Silvibacterium sp.]
MKHPNTREVIFKLPNLTAYIASITPSPAGNIISTGTPGDVGSGRIPQCRVRAREAITIEMTRLGKLVNPVAAGK